MSNLGDGQNNFAHVLSVGTTHLSCEQITTEVGMVMVVLMMAVIVIIIVIIVLMVIGEAHVCCSG